MLQLNLINQSFSQKEKKYLREIKNLFAFLNQKEIAQKVSLANLNINLDKLHGLINLILIDNSQIQKINFQYRQKNTPTDVLSFPYLEEKEIAQNQDPDEVLGEIFISKEKALKDSEDLNITFQEELNKIFIHGVLHLLGYDHILESDFKKMQKKEELILEAYLREKK